MNSIESRIPSLDGLRAVSIVLVICAHLQGTNRFPRLTFLNWAGSLGQLGVTVFFIISGFLITSLLMNERTKTGTISLEAFYRRRARRILPALYVFILGLVAAAHFGWLQLKTADLLFALTFTANYDPAIGWNVGHLWSLSLEEQFYLIWPLLFFKLRTSDALSAALVGFFTGPLVRLITHILFGPQSPWRDLEIFPTDSIAIGCILALLRPQLLTQLWYLRFTRSSALLLLIPLTLIVNKFLGYTMVSVLVKPFMLISITVLIEASTRNTGLIIQRILNAQSVAFVGTLSYSLYLWQQPFLNRNADASLTAFPQNLMIAFAAALLSYFLVERPLLKKPTQRGRNPVASSLADKSV